jgi:hypothetical protein
MGAMPASSARTEFANETGKARPIAMQALLFPARFILIVESIEGVPFVAQGFGISAYSGEWRGFERAVLNEGNVQTKAIVRELFSTWHGLAP